MRLSALLKKLDRYVLVPLILIITPITMLSGYAITSPALVEGLTLGLIGYHNAYKLHLTLKLPLWTLLMSHGMLNIRILLAGRVGGFKWAVDAIILLSYIALVAIPVYIEVARAVGTG